MGPAAGLGFCTISKKPTFWRLTISELFRTGITGPLPCFFQIARPSRTAPASRLAEPRGSTNTRLLVPLTSLGATRPWRNHGIIQPCTVQSLDCKSATGFSPNRASLKDRTCIQTSRASRQHQYASFGAPSVSGGDPPLEKSRIHPPPGPLVQCSPSIGKIQNTPRL